MKLITTLLIFFVFVTSNIYSQKPKYVILITIDGLRPEMITDSVSPAPYLKMMKEEGLFVHNVKGIAPTATYPSHTTIVTGVRPIEHGIYYNAPFSFNKKSSLAYWYADSIKSPTMWQVAKENGLTTASLFWPVSTCSKYIDYNIPEFWSTESVANQLDFLKSYCTPKGILEELESEATGKLDHNTFAAGTINRDARTAYMANYIMNKYKPNLMTIHLIATDYSQHATGTKSMRVDQTIASADNAVGLILENLKQQKMEDSTAVIVYGDHGFIDVSKRISPNAWLVEENLLSKEPGGDWRACFQKGGATMFLYLKDKKDIKTLDIVREKLNSLPQSVRQLFRIVEKEELKTLGCSPDVVLAIEPMKGVDCSTSRTDSKVLSVKAGNHGYISGYDPTALIAVGKQIKKQRVEFINQTDIAPYVYYILGIESNLPSFSLKTLIKD